MTDIIRIEFFRRTAGYTLYDHTMNEEILKEPAEKKLRRY